MQHLERTQWIEEPNIDTSKLLEELELRASIPCWHVSAIRRGKWLELVCKRVSHLQLRILVFYRWVAHRCKSIHPSDISDESISFATNNVARNNLQNSITVLKNNTSRIFPPELFALENKKYSARTLYSNGTCDIVVFFFCANHGQISMIDTTSACAILHFTRTSKTFTTVKATRPTFQPQCV